LIYRINLLLGTIYCNFSKKKLTTLEKKLTLWWMYWLKKQKLFKMNYTLKLENHIRNLRVILRANVMKMRLLTKTSRILSNKLSHRDIKSVSSTLRLKSLSNMLVSLVIVRIHTGINIKEMKQITLKLDKTNMVIQLRLSQHWEPSLKVKKM